MRCGRAAGKGSGGDLEKRLAAVDNLIYKLVWIAWRRFPPYDRVWIYVDDLHQEAVIHVIHKYSEYNPATSAWTTFVWTIVSHYLSNSVTYHRAEKRRCSGWVSLDEVDYGRGRDVVLDPLVDEVLRCMARLSPVG